MDLFLGFKKILTFLPNKWQCLSFDYNQKLFDLIEHLKPVETFTFIFRVHQQQKKIVHVGVGFNLCRQQLLHVLLIRDDPHGHVASTHILLMLDELLTIIHTLVQELEREGAINFKNLEQVAVFKLRNPEQMKRHLKHVLIERNKQRGLGQVPRLVLLIHVQQILEQRVLERLDKTLIDGAQQLALLLLPMPLNLRQGFHLPVSCTLRLSSGSREQFVERLEAHLNKGNYQKK